MFLFYYLYIDLFIFQALVIHDYTLYTSFILFNAFLNEDLSYYLSLNIYLILFSLPIIGNHKCVYANNTPSNTNLFNYESYDYNTAHVLVNLNDYFTFST